MAQVSEPREPAGQVVCADGNLAFAFTPSELDAGAAYRFVLYHVLHDAPMHDIFRIDGVELGQLH